MVSDENVEHVEPESFEAGSDGKKSEGSSFEEELGRLEEAVEQLEAGTLSLEEAIGRFESGFRSMKNCYHILQNAQKRIESLCSTDAEEEGSDTAENRPSWKSFEVKHPPLAEEQTTRKTKRPRRRSTPKSGGGPETEDGPETDRPSRGSSYADDFAATGD